MDIGDPVREGSRNHGSLGETLGTRHLERGAAEKGETPVDLLGHDHGNPLPGRGCLGRIQACIGERSSMGEAFDPGIPAGIAHAESNQLLRRKYIIEAHDPAHIFLASGSRDYLHYVRPEARAFLENCLERFERVRPFEIMERADQPAAVLGRLPADPLAHHRWGFYLQVHVRRPGLYCMEQPRLGGLGGNPLCCPAGSNERKTGLGEQLVYVVQAQRAAVKPDLGHLDAHVVVHGIENLLQFPVLYCRANHLS